MGKVKKLFLSLLGPDHLQLKITHVPQRHIPGWSALHQSQGGQMGRWHSVSDRNFFKAFSPKLK